MAAPPSSNPFAALSLESPDSTRASSPSSERAAAPSAGGGGSGGGGQGAPPTTAAPNPASASGWLPAGRAPPEPRTTTAAPNPASASGRLPAGRAPPEPRTTTAPLLKHPLIWLDLEMTGLDYGPGGDAILELAMLATDGELGHETPGPAVAIHHPAAVLASMNAWSERTHARTGLTARCAASGVTTADAEAAAIDFVCRVMGWPGGGPPPGALEAAAGEDAPDGGAKRPRLATLAGSSVHVDLCFLRARMPRLAACFSHRVLDVSSLGEAVHRWHPAAYHSRPRLGPAAPDAHTAAADVRASLAILKWYRSTVFQRDGREVRRAVARHRSKK